MSRLQRMYLSGFVVQFTTEAMIVNFLGSILGTAYPFMIF